MAVDLPQQFADRYRIDELIAEGGMARVYRGTDTVLGRTVAIKVLSAALATDPSFVARFEREAQSVASLNHPNLVGVYDVGSEGDHHFIVMEYVHGSTLDAVIKQSAPMEAAQVADIALNVCEGLGAAHLQGIVHRDIKPANIMIEPGGRVKVMDFGIAKTSVEGLTQVGAVLGTVKYLAPEQAYGRPIDERADIYALGCVMYEMLTGRPPTPGETLMEIAHKLATERPAPPSSINPEVPGYLDRVVMRSLQKDPEDRYPSTAAMALDLRDQSRGNGMAVAPADGSYTVVESPGSPTRVLNQASPPPPSRRLGLLIVALLLLAGGAYALFNNLRAENASDPGLVLTPPAAVPEPPPPPPTESPTPSPSPSPSPTPSPTPTEQEEEEPVEVPAPGLLQGIAANIQNLIDAGISSGSVTERAGGNVMDEVSKAVSESEKGDAEGALKNVEDARQEVLKYVEREEITLQSAVGINAQLDRMAAALG